MKHFTAKLGLTLGGALLLMVPLCSAAVGDFTIYPSYMHGDNKNWIIQKVSAGNIVTDFVTLENTTDRGKTLQLVVREAELRGNSFLTKEDRPFENLGTWIKLPQTEYTLKPYEKVKIPVEITVPKETDARQYMGTILATGSEKADSLNIVTRIGVRVYLDVLPAGTLHANIFTATGSPDPAFFIFSFLLLGGAIVYNVINYLGHASAQRERAGEPDFEGEPSFTNKKYENQKA